MEQVNHKSNAISSSAIKNNHARKYLKNRYKRRNALDGLGKDTSFVDSFIMQCTVSGMILALLLFVRFVDVPFTHDLRQSLKSAIETDMKIQDVSQVGNVFKSAFDNVQKSVTSLLFGNKNATDTSELTQNVETNTPTPSAKPTVTPEAGNANTNTNTQTAPPQPTDFRIDEDILNEINSREDFYNTNEIQ